MEQWRLMQSQPLLKTTWLKPPITYKNGKSLKDTPVISKI